MEFIKQFPRWALWAIGALALILAVLVIAWFIRSGRPSLPPGLVEKREEVGRILAERERLSDVNVKPLVELEARRDFKGAAALMDQALGANARQEELNASLATVSNELAKLAVGVRPDAVGERAVAAFGALRRLAEAERRYYQDRRALYEMTRGYYSDLATGLKPPIPDRLPELVDAVNADLEKAKAVHAEFASAVSAFDQAAAGR